MTPFLSDQGLSDNAAMNTTVPNGSRLSRI
jgi:hypothetical protein